MLCKKNVQKLRKPKFAHILNIFFAQKIVKMKTNNILLNVESSV